ncbi:GntR family transcriptional regulator [Bacillus sp. V3-13]|uniref:GntR family transcriptional regulator n=1 Tax=Bacillus sp. V3-13 TaxID=2053728 RepID=UPI000C76E46F|nr:GntR family transcriptional regulator [Bacillus sp. V3-13]PLR75902.1 GntR family transcriptional regulator [Bacillus sp. V3-13]
MKQTLDFMTLEEKVTSTIRKAIFTQILKPGERLIQDELAAKLGVSRMPVREALRSLEREGLVELLPHKGAVVIGITRDDIEELYFLRSQLEGMTVQKSMCFLTEEDFAELEVLIQQMDKDIDNENIDSFVFHNKQFHLLLQKGCKWKKVKLLSKQFIEGYPAYVPSLVPAMVKDSNKEHKEMLKTLAEKDPLKLRLLVEQHIMRAGNMLTQLLE